MKAPPTQAQLEAAKGLESAICARSPKSVESAVIQAFSALHPIQAPALILIVEAPWHQCHEDVVRALQILRSPGAVGALERTVSSNHEYLGYNNNHALARKCTWALADIGTPDAYLALTRIANDAPDPTVAGFAKKRLENWEKESHRKR